MASPLDPNRTHLTPDSSDKSSFVSESCMCSEKVSGGECEIRSSLFSLLQPRLSLPRFTNVWMPLTRNQDHSKGV